MKNVKILLEAVNLEPRQRVYAAGCDKALKPSKCVMNSRAALNTTGAFQTDKIGQNTSA